MKVLISGISGQDGSYLSEYLIEEGYEVYGLVRRHSVAEDQSTRLERIYSSLKKVFYADLLDEHALYRVMEEVKPDVIYNLAAMSHVRISFDVPSFTIKTNALGVLNMLEIARNVVPNVKFYQASSSEMFGNNVNEDGYQNLQTPMHPVSPYGCAKVMGYNLTVHYRNAYKMHACNGILFNHESPRRGTNFVTNKVVKTAVQIKEGLVDKLELGNMDSSRDWGHSYDYVRAMHKIVNHDEPSDWIVATGESKTVRQMCEYVFRKLNMDYKDYVVQNPKFMRPEELKYLRGDSLRTRKELKWTPKYTFETMLDEMIDYWDFHFNGTPIIA
jgi:GDPmannose 4,6-dehydratase|tara:strand:+ start:755 stop:1741 length:987 start_codon:yes stop_codon:yes gene_type:complete